MTGMKGLFNLGKIGALKAITSDFAKNKIKGMADKYIYHIKCSVVQGLPAIRKAVTAHITRLWCHSVRLMNDAFIRELSS